jgi:hypothetical protein
MQALSTGCRAACFMNSSQFLAKPALVALDRNVKPEIEVFYFGMIHIAFEVFRKSFNKIQ